jgi:hypothetical protein
MAATSGRARQRRPATLRGQGFHLIRGRLTCVVGNILVLLINEDIQTGSIISAHLFQKRLIPVMQKSRVLLVALRPTGASRPTTATRDCQSCRPIPEDRGI